MRIIAVAQSSLGITKVNDNPLVSRIPSKRNADVLRISLVAVFHWHQYFFA